jgi:hypothetical protein
MDEYSVITGPLFNAALAELSPEARRECYKKLAELAEDPSELEPQGNPRRTASFGEAGLIFATVSDEHRVIIADLLIWVGD